MDDKEKYALLKEDMLCVFNIQMGGILYVAGCGPYEIKPTKKRDELRDKRKYETAVKRLIKINETRSR